MAEYTGTVSNFLSRAFERLNDSLAGFAQNFSAGLATEIAPLVVSALILTIIVMGIMAIRGLLDTPFLDVAWVLTRASIITTIALTSAVYQSWVVDVFLTLPDDLVASVMNTAVKGSNVATGQSAAKAIEEIYDLGSYNAGLYFNEAGLTNLPPMLYGSLVWLGTIACVLMGALWLFISKIVLSLMIGVGPIFICCLIWNPTQSYFWSWVGQIVNTVLTSIFVLAIFAIFASIFKTGLLDLDVSSASEGFMNAATYTFLGILSMAALIKIPEYVSALTGAAGGAIGTAMGRISKGAISMAAGGAGGMLNAARGAVAAKSAAGAYQGARSGGAGVLSAANAGRHQFNRSMDDMKRGYPMHYQKGVGEIRQRKPPATAYHQGAGGTMHATPSIGSKFSQQNQVLANKVQKK